jgi:hypothetical protein
VGAPAYTQLPDYFARLLTIHDAGRLAGSAIGGASTPRTGVVDPTWKNDGRAYVGVEELDLVEYAKRLGMEWELELHTIAPPELEPALEPARRLASR